MTISAEHTYLNAGIAHAGYLMKRNPTGAWQKRFCVVTKDKFIYYKHKARVEKGMPQGTVSLVGSSFILPEPGDINCLKRENCFVLKSSNKEYYLSCEAKKEFGEWQKAMNECIAILSKASTKESPHSFKKVHFSKPTNCAKCSTPIHGLGKQGFMCQVCLTCAHKKCAFKLEDDCGAHPPAIKPPPPKKGIMERFRFTLTTNSTTQYASLDVAQLQVTLGHAEEAEQGEIDLINKKYNEQVNEIMDELIYRYLTEVKSIDNEYAKKKQVLLKEIQIRQKG